MFAAGSETTASMMSITLFYIIATPTAYQRLKSEMKMAVEKGEVSCPITMAEAKRLPYLQVWLFASFCLTSGTVGIFCLGTILGRWWGILVHTESVTNNTS